MNAAWKIAVISVVMATASACDAAVESLRVMTYNIWVGGTVQGQPLSRTVGVIQTSQADVIGIQEVGGSGQAIANALGFYYYNFNSDLSIISRYPIVQTLNSGVKLELSATQEAYLYNVHLSAYPYQPYDMRDGLITTEAQAIAEADAARGGQIDSVLNGMAGALATGAPVFLVGDFNEPSHLDWTQAAANAGLNFGKKVAWPASTATENAGLTDAFRELRPDEINDRGATWTPGYPAPFLDSNEVLDRIDYVYYAGLNVTPTSAQVYGYDANDPHTDVGIQPYPSDHRSLVVEFDVPSCSLLGDLDDNCSLTSSDWQQFRNWQHTDLTGLTRAQAYAKGDLNGDHLNNHADFVIFKTAYEATNGQGSFAAMFVVPEPTCAVLGGAWALVIAGSRWPRRNCRHRGAQVPSC